MPIREPNNPSTRSREERRGALPLQPTPPSSPFVSPRNFPFSYALFAGTQRTRKLVTDAHPRGDQRRSVASFETSTLLDPRWKRWRDGKTELPLPLALPSKVGGHARGINRGDTRRKPQLTCRVSAEFCRTKRTIFTRTLRGMDRSLLF